MIDLRKFWLQIRPNAAFWFPWYLHPGLQLRSYLATINFRRVSAINSLIRAIRCVAALFQRALRMTAANNHGASWRCHLRRCLSRTLSTKDQSSKYSKSPTKAADDSRRAFREQYLQFFFCAFDEKGNDWSAIRSRWTFLTQNGST